MHDTLALTSLREAVVFVWLLPPYSPDFDPAEDVFSEVSSRLREWVSPEQDIEWPMLSIDSVMRHAMGDRC